MTGAREHGGGGANANIFTTIYGLTRPEIELMIASRPHTPAATVNDIMTDLLDRIGRDWAAKVTAQIGKTLEERGGTHGNFISQHQRLAALSKELGLSRSDRGEEALLSLVALKLSRIANTKDDLNFHEDHIVDAIGYLALYGAYRYVFSKVEDYGKLWQICEEMKSSPQRG